MIWKNNISFFKMVSFLVFVLVSLFIYDWKAHIVFPLLKNLHPALPFLCSSTVSLSFVIYFLFFSVYRSSTTLLLPLLTNFRLLHSVLYEEQFFICDLFSFLKDIFALDFRLENYGRKDFLVAGVSCYHLAKAHETNLTSWALVQKSSGQVRFSPPTLLATMHFGSQPWSLPFFRLVLSMHQQFPFLFRLSYNEAKGKN